MASRSKKHAIIPVFIPHKGCPNDCIFCNQRKITARSAAVTPGDVRTTIRTWLTTLQDVPVVEAAFYGGSFTGIPLEEQRAYLEVAREYKRVGAIQKIHLSTRPDYITPEILDNLKEYSVDTIELGVQSFDEDVLRQSRRGHTAQQVYDAVSRIQSYGFELGIQLMIGLPGDTMEKCLYSARETARLRPQLARLYPTIVLDETDLYEEYRQGTYIPLSREEAVLRTKEMYKILEAADITIMRVGLKSTDLIGDGGAINGGTYHPAFRQLVEGAIVRERIEPLLNRLKLNASGNSLTENKQKIDVFSNGKWYSNMVGNEADNKSILPINFRNSISAFAGTTAWPTDSSGYLQRRKKMDREKAVVTVTGRDEVGILASVSACCANANASVIEMTQSVKQDFFTMMMVISIEQMNVTIAELRNAILKELPTMDVHVMHENIFNSMHRI